MPTCLVPTILVPFLPYIYVALFYLVTWLPSLRGGFVSDDIEGLLKFSDRFDSSKDEAATTYEVEHDGKKFPLGHRAFNKYVTFPGSIIRWARLNLGARFQIIGKNKKGHEVYGYVQSPLKHHIINLAIHLGNILLAYQFLSQMFGPNVALAATLLFTVHPLSCQAVAWCSGIGYLLCLFGSLLSLNTALLITDWHWLVPAIGASTFLSVTGMMAGAGTWIILWFLGYKMAAYAAFGVAAIALWKQGRALVSYRAAEFKKQQMGKSTSLNWRKPILMVKTAYYYMKLLIWPKRLGLFHTWGYHFDEKLECIDGMFWKGAALLVGLAFVSLQGPLAVQLGLLWMLVYVAIFLNFITAQQFVADRYAFIPALGFCLVLAWALQPFPLLTAFIVGLYLMRTWTHLPTFENEIKFYQSNIWNFPESEVAYGNLGVIYANNQFPGSAADTWMLASKINPLYDVPLYNLYSMFRGSGHLHQAREFLQRCLNSKVVHFPEIWTKELDRINSDILINRDLRDHIKQINHAIGEAKYERT